MYSLQRKLKASRQTAESRDLHTGFLQKKVAALEEKLKTVGQHDSGVESAVDKVRGTMLACTILSHLTF